MMVCKTRNCNNEVKTKGLCSHCYYKLRAYGDPNYQKEKKINICTIENCLDTVIAKNLCWKHYQRLRRYGRTSIKPKHNEICLIKKCDKKYFARGFCCDHYYSHYYKRKIKNDRKS